VHVFLETERLVLRRFTTGDVDNLAGLDADPDVMRFVSGGIPTSRDEIENEFLPAFLGYYQRYQAFGFWAAIEKSTGDFLGWFHFRPRQGTPRTRSSSVTGCASQPGARGTLPKGRAR
jgi:RimJ/RimL family protein N-acetyltransferase